MSHRRSGGPKDANQPIIVKALRKVGASVAITTEVGGGFPDLVVGYRMETHLLELKVPGGKLRPTQVEFHRDWHGKPIHVVESVEQAFIACKVTTTHRRDAGFPVTPPEVPPFDSANWRFHP